ncbi:MAG: YraN family protein [Elusimicrobiota bacterium]|jgi:putative endonuclease|nr:YraN family protein [Elusimicrobiota bacterium]
MKTEKRLHGDDGENLAATYLKEKGYKIIARNYLTKLGEIDIIALKNKTLVFVEVKTRSTASFGGGIAAVGPSKQDRIAKTAIEYIKHNKPTFDGVIFDIIAITDGKAEHIQNAFAPRGFTF